MTGFYDEMRDVATELLDEFKQGVVQLKRVTLDTPPNEWTPAPETGETWPLSARIKRLRQRYEDGVLIVETGDMVIRFTWDAFDDITVVADEIEYRPRRLTARSSAFPLEWRLLM